MTGPGPATVLIVDDEPRNRKLLELLLRTEGYITVAAASGEEALASIALQAPDLVLLDIMMPGLDGYEVARRLKADAETSSIPIIMVTAQIDRSARLDGLAAGAEEFLTKPVDRSELCLRVRNLLRLKALGDFFHNHSSLLEETVRARTADLHHLAHFDALTELPNRSLFYETLRKLLTVAGDRRVSVVVLFVDIDHFKHVNDNFGHDVGDELLRQFGERLLGCVRTRDTVGRLGGDEFGIILTVRDAQVGATAVATKIREALATGFVLGNHVVFVTASIGITVHPEDADDPDALVKFADTAMYRAKQAGRNTFRFFTQQMNADVLAQLDLEVALRKAVEGGEFELHYQPKADLVTGRVAGVEALLRWHRPGVGMVPPDRFIPTLEANGLIVNVGSWVIAEACKQIRGWRDAGLGDIRVAVNISSRQFVDGDLAGDILRALADNDLSADLLELELTEGTLIFNTDRTVAMLEELRAAGMRISVDDFGTGYSSLAYLRRFPVDALKIDIVFTRDLTTNPDAAAIALAVINMAHSLKLDVIAEGVETAEQLTYLRDHHCDQIQGYYFSRPLPAAELATFIAADARLPDAEVPNETILLVHDDHEVLSDLVDLLGGEDYRVLTARSATEGFERLAMHHVQVVLSGHQLPTDAGSLFLDQVMELHPDATRIVVSADADLGSILDDVNRGAVHRCYTIPWDDAALRDGIRSVLRTRRLATRTPVRGRTGVG